MNDKGERKPAPADDLTFSSDPSGEQSMMVMGEGKNPTISHLVKLGREAKLPQKHIDDIIERTRHALGSWKALATDYNVLQKNIDLVAKTIGKNS